MFHYVYVLLSRKDKGFYTGYTKDLQGRFEVHSKGRVMATKDRRPLQIVYSEACLDNKDALRRERYFKTHHGKMFLHSRLKSYLTGCKNF
jgi:putative endonuclease